MQGTLRYLEIGKDKAKTREQLCELSGLCDRVVRREIEALRDKGIIIINNQDGKGYYISEDVEEMQRQFRQNQARAMSILRQQKHLRRRMAEVVNERLEINK